MQITLQIINVPTKTLDKMIEFFVCICEKNSAFLKKIMNDLSKFC